MTSMHCFRDEILPCPHCRRGTPHLVVTERVVAAVLWCRSCFSTRVAPKPEPARAGG